VTPDASIATPPHALTYDTLPAHGTLRRDVELNVLSITAAAQEPDERMRRVARVRSAVPAALLSGALLVAFLAALASTYLDHRRYIGAALGAVLFVAFVVFCGALFLFVWRAQFTARIDALELALRQTTILAASPGRLLIESAGPLGQASHELASDALAICVAGSALHPSLACLEIVARDHAPLQLLAGRDESELHWVARALQGALEPRGAAQSESPLSR
jgi:hypothetical protein